MLTSFLQQLFDGQPIRVGSLPTVSSRDEQSAVTVLKEFDSQVRLACPAGLPGIEADAALWAAKQVFYACTFSVHRDTPADVVVEAMAEQRDTADPSPAVHYSVDLTFRFLPDLIRRATAASESDPLVDALLKHGRRWPLSSVGVEFDSSAFGVDPDNLEPILRSKSLSRLYVDRVIDRQDTTRLADPQVAELAQAALGSFPTLSEQLASSFTAALSRDVAPSPAETP